jgi:hypothetical protein
MQDYLFLGTRQTSQHDREKSVALGHCTETPGWKLTCSKEKHQLFPSHHFNDVPWPGEKSCLDTSWSSDFLIPGGEQIYCLKRKLVIARRLQTWSCLDRSGLCCVVLSLLMINFNLTSLYKFLPHRDCDKTHQQFQVLTQTLAQSIR